MTLLVGLPGPTLTPYLLLLQPCAVCVSLLVVPLLLVSAGGSQFSLVRWLLLLLSRALVDVGLSLSLARAVVDAGLSLSFARSAGG